MDDGINYTGTDFPTSTKQIDRLEAQNEFLAINVYGWEKNKVVVNRISKKEKRVPRINLMLIELGETRHYCYVKRVSALLFDSKMNNKTYHCMLCLTRFTTRKVLANHEKYCNGVNGRPTRIEMPQEGRNKITFQNYNKIMKMPYVVYADFEAIIHKMKGCERPPESTGREEEQIRNNLSVPKPIKMTPRDWKEFRTATDCHICEKSLVKEEFLDSLPVWFLDAGIDD